VVGPHRQPAAWTLVQLEIPQPRHWQTARGLADSLGRAAVIFPYPEAEPSSLASPLLRAEPHWQLNIRARHAPELRDELFANLDRLDALESEMPSDLSTAESPSLPFAGAELVLGRELILTPELWIVS
jgi:hypothetical protein